MNHKKCNKIENFKFILFFCIANYILIYMKTYTILKKIQIKNLSKKPHNLEIFFIINLILK